jgi:hypothetical protein
MAAPPLEGERRAALLTSLRLFQLGETGEGRICREIHRFRHPGIDDDYREALSLFVAEEGRHARVLGSAVRAMEGRPLRQSWSESSFRQLRRLMGVRTKLAALLAAEVVGLTFYSLLLVQLPEGELRSALAQICRDEDGHLEFHVDFFRRCLPEGPIRALFPALWLALAMGATLAMALDHRRALWACDLPLRAVLRRAWSHGRRAMRLLSAPGTVPLGRGLGGWRGALGVSTAMP